mmetsp:Transcript_40244/g.89357  ORF Transcript_40244/g.89357 Transcript_40244/m.89357 type:complete len:193 (-) Transcript_40244:691-1269(-)|eukprot:CAMPEP_0202902254 /NCGR_PEP_ID=MMETSP1392-20130828/16751_1 /ASSEMBLY_ACC=CAM_ASM_000868 /TAXON_ID=225041 /ORGANISM="Chlamydomonas chlamydogama, Strain SAG 11-48b" /LENGTH=192 /DNA_ID=CAMNT_0049588995 /DNA_START=205 /DNA_END=783 /DNA_ORIENTATION=-
MSNKFPVYNLGQGKGTPAEPPKNVFDIAERGTAAQLTRLVERQLDFDINQRDNIQRTALHWAAELQNYDVAAALMDYGCDINAVECNGRTAVHLAARAADRTMLDTLLTGLDDETVGKLVNQRDNFGMTPVFLCKQKTDEGAQAAFELLMLRGGKYTDNISVPSSNPTSPTGATAAATASPTAAGSERPNGQ